MESAVVDLLAGKIAAIIQKEASLIRGALEELEKELKSMKSFIEDAKETNGLTEKELKSMKSFIEDAKETNGLTAVLRDWVASVMEICHPVEDIIEEFMHHLSKPRKHANFLKLPKDLWKRRRVANKIQEINKKLKSIPERGQRYGATQIEGNSSRDDHNADQRRVKKQNEAIVYAKSDRLVGMDDDGRNLEEWLTTGERELITISIVGMGGSGKTSLAAKAYNSPTVKRSFDCYTWITVSQTYEIDDLLRIMIKEFYSSQKMGVPMDLRSLEYKDLLGMLVEYLKSKRYTVVLDDVWDMKLWKDTKISFPEEGRGSRVILTTRNENIAAASYGVRSHIHSIKLSHKLLQKCEGLPLAILALGGALSSKKLLSEWIQFSSSLNHELSNNDTFDEVKKRILLFSFKDLSYQLKRCFLYCCLFPEDYPLKRKRLIRLWMAEGFVNKSRSKTPELMADDYLLEHVFVVCQYIRRKPRKENTYSSFVNT